MTVAERATVTDRPLSDDAARVRSDPRLRRTYLRELDVVLGEELDDAGALVRGAGAFRC